MCSFLQFEILKFLAQRNYASRFAHNYCTNLFNIVERLIVTFVGWI